MLAIEDPFDQKRDDGHNVWGVQRIKYEFELAYVTLTQEGCSFGKVNVSDVKRYILLVCFFTKFTKFSYSYMPCLF